MAKIKGRLYFFFKTLKLSANACEREHATTARQQAARAKARHRPHKLTHSAPPRPTGRYLPALSLWINEVLGLDVLEHFGEEFARLPLGHRQVMEQVVTTIARPGARYIPLVIGHETKRAPH